MYNHPTCIKFPSFGPVFHPSSPWGYTPITFLVCTLDVRANQSLVPPAPWKKNTIGQSLEDVASMHEDGTSSSTSHIDDRP